MKLRRITSVAIALSLAGLVALPASAQAADRCISVSASGTVKVKPDTVRLSATVSVVSAANKDAVVDAVVASTDNSLSIDGVTPFVYDTAVASQAARVAAVASAKSKALSYAKLLKVSLGKIVYLEESAAPNPVVMAMAKSDAGATQIDLGQQDLTISINTRWAL